MISLLFYWPIFCVTRLPGAQFFAWIICCLDWESLYCRLPTRMARFRGLQLPNSDSDDQWWRWWWWWWWWWWWRWQFGRQPGESDHNVTREDATLPLCGWSCIASWGAFTQQPSAPTQIKTNKDFLIYQYGNMAQTEKMAELFLIFMLHFLIAPIFTLALFSQWEIIEKKWSTCFDHGGLKPTMHYMTWIILLDACQYIIQCFYKTLSTNDQKIDKDNTVHWHDQSYC